MGPLMSSAPDHLVELCRPGSLIEANAVVEGLEAAGIPARLQGNDLQDVFGTIGWTFAPRVLVDAENLVAASEILTEITNNQEQSSETSDDIGLNCLECGTLMNEDETCPDCGWTYTVKPTPRSKAISDESNEPNQPPMNASDPTDEILKDFEPQIWPFNDEGIGNPPAS